MKRVTTHCVSVDVCRQIRLRILGTLAMEVWPAARRRCPIILCRHEQGKLSLNVLEGVENAHEALGAENFLLLLLRHGEGPLRIAHERGAWTPCIVRVDSDPPRLVLGLDHFQPIKSSLITVTARYLLLRIVVIL